MKKLILSLVVVVVASVPSVRAQGIFGTGVEINGILYANNNGGTTRLTPVGSTATLDQTSFGASPEANATFNLGSFPTSGTLTLNGFSVLTYNGNTAVTSATANYRIFSGTTPPTNGGFAPVSLTLNQQGVSGNNGDTRFSIETLGTNLLASLAPGNYTLGVYYNADFGTDGISYDNNANGANYGATFTVTAVPEPSTWATMFLGVGGMAAVVLRRRTVTT